MRVTVIAASFGVVGALWIGVSAQQEMLPKPGPGSGVTRVTGDVRVAGDINVANTPNVRVVDTPTIRVVDLPPLAIAPPPFARKGGSYIVTWGDGGTENVILADIGPDGWVRTEGGRPRWINLRLAKAVEQR